MGLMLSLLVSGVGCTRSSPPEAETRSEIGDRAAPVAHEDSTRPAAPGLPSTPGQPQSAGRDGKALYESYCGACHSLEVVEGQRLDRGGWDWVLDDMIEEYGAEWITLDERALIADHLVRTFGPDRPR